MASECPMHKGAKRCAHADSPHGSNRWVAEHREGPDRWIVSVGSSAIPNVSTGMEVFDSEHDAVFADAQRIFLEAPDEH